jgi:transcriptional regulator with XRE-family HTH domain
MDLATRVRKRREELGLSQEDLALRMGYSSRTSINKIENGRPCSQKIIARLADALMVGIPYLMGWDEEEKEQPINIDGLSEKQMAFILKIMQMSDAELDRAEKVLSLVENKG